MTRIRVGIGGWTFAPWRGRFYPPGLKHADELSHASRQLTTIEINGTFYRQQSPASFAAWRDETPENFVFSVKAHRAATHSADPDARRGAIDRFLGSGLAELGTKLGPILWQFPPLRRFDADAFKGFLDALPAALDRHPLRHVVEARHPSFATPEVLSLMRERRVTFAVIDSDKQMLAADRTGDIVYARLQRNSADAPEGYDTRALDRWAGAARAWATGTAADLPTITPALAAEACDVFLLFIAGDKQRAPDAAQAMIRRLGAP